MSREGDIEAVLSPIDPDATVKATPEPDESRIVVACRRKPVRGAAQPAGLASDRHDPRRGAGGQRDCHCLSSTGRLAVEFSDYQRAASETDVYKKYLRDGIGLDRRASAAWQAGAV